jgi:hypothetical protein
VSQTALCIMLAVEATGISQARASRHQRGSGHPVTQPVRNISRPCGSVHRSARFGRAITV